MKNLFKAIKSKEIVTFRIPNNEVRQGVIKSFNDNGKVYVSTKDEYEHFKGYIELENLIDVFERNTPLKKAIANGLEIKPKKFKLIETAENTFKIEGDIPSTKYFNTRIIEIKLSEDTLDEENISYRCELTFGAVGSSVVVVDIKANSKKKLYKKLTKVIHHIYTNYFKEMRTNYKNFLASK